MPIPKRRIITPQIITTKPGRLPRRLVIIFTLFAVWTWVAYQFGRDGFDLDLIAPPEQVVDSGRKLEKLKVEYENLKREANAIGKARQELGDAKSWQWIRSTNCRKNV